jgi:hypothetical protein
VSPSSRAGKVPFWFSALTVFVNVGLLVGFVAWLGPWGLLPTFLGVFVASFAMASIERERWGR